MKRKPISRLISLIIIIVMLTPAFVVPAQAVTLDKTFTVYLVPNTHLDTAWQSPFPQIAYSGGSNGIMPMFTNATTALESTQYGELKFTTSASAHLKMLKDYYNDDNPTSNQRLWSKVQTLVDKEQLDLAGGQIVEPDLNIPNGEALVRQSLYAQHFFLSNFTRQGEPYYSITGMVPDVFGFSGQLPQILMKSQMKYFVTSKVNWNNQDYGGAAIGSSYEHYRTAGSNGARGRDSDIMTWQALDGESTVLANFLQADYNSGNVGQVQNAFDANWVTATTNDASGFRNNINFHGGVRSTGIKKAVLFYGGGDFGQGMNAGLGDNSINSTNSFRYHEYAATTSPGSLVNVKTSTITQFFEELVETENLERVNTVDGNYIEGEIYAEFHRGTYTSWARVKKYNRDNEILGESAEKAATIGFYTNSVSTNSSQRIEDGWYKILINQMHDVLPGSAIAWQYYLTFNQQELAKNLFNGVRDNALAAIAYRANTNVVGKPVFVYNELSWARGGEITVRLQYDADTMPEGGLVVYDGNTAIIPSKIVRNESKYRIDVTFNATPVPAIGYKIFDVRAEEPGARTTPLSFDQSTWTITNDNLIVRFNPLTGYIASLQTKVGGDWKEMFAQGVGTEGGELHVYEDCDQTRPSQDFDQWNINRAEINRDPWYYFQTTPVSMSVTCNTPEKVTVSVTKVWNGQNVTQDFSVLSNSDRVDVHLAANWYLPKRLLKVSFPILADNYNATFETSFGAVERPTRRDNVFGYARFEVPMHKWSDVTDNSGGWGVSILNDAKYGNDVLRQTVNGTTFIRSRITVVRTPQAQAWSNNGTYPPSNPLIDSARHEFNYSIAPHAGGWQDARTVNKAAELNYPMKAFETPKNAGAGFGSSESFASSNKSNVIISALKNQYDEPDNKNKIVVRAYESSGRETNDVTITLPGNIVPGTAKEVNMLEHEYNAANGYSGTNAYTVKPLTVSGNTITFNINKYEIITIEAVLEPSTQAALPLPQQSLALAYNSRGVTPNSSRTAGYIAGTGASTSNVGLSMPQEHWPANNQINYNGILFNLGTPNANNFLNATSTSNNTITVTPAQGYSKLYIVGVAVPSTGTSAVRNNPFQRAPATGEFTVNYASGAPTKKEIVFNNWRTELSGWNRTALRDDEAYVYDTVAHFNGHYHLHTGNNGEMQEADNYLFVYDIDLDNTRNVSSIEIPISSNIKIAAMTLADPVAGFGTVYEHDSSIPAPASNVKARYSLTATPIYGSIDVSWDPSPDAVSYSVFRGTSPNFTPSSSTEITTEVGTSYTDACPTISAAEMNAGLTFYYKVIANSETRVPSAASDPSNGLVPAYVDYALNIVTSENTSRVVANRQQSSEQAFKAINGVISGTSNKWCATGVTSTNPGRWAIDLTGSASAPMPKIEYVRINHSVEGAGQITGAFTLSYATTTTAAMSTTGIVASNTPNGFTQFANITGNSTLVTTHYLPSDGVNLRYLLLVVTNPAINGDSNNATRIYEVYAIGKNMNFVEPTSMAEDIKITQTPAIDAAGYFNQSKFSVDYNFYNANEEITEDIAKTEFAWSKQLSNGTSVALPGSTSDIIVSNADLVNVKSVNCTVTVWDSADEKGLPASSAIIVNEYAETNVLLGATVVSQITGNTTASNLVDGNRTSSSKWDYITGTNNPSAVPGPWSAVLDMGTEKEFNRFTVYHSNAFPTQDYDANPLIPTYDFDLSYSSDNVTWVTKEIRANTLAITDVDLGGVVSARYVRMTVITPNNGGTTFDTAYKSIRVAELEANLDTVTQLSPSPVALYSGANKVSLASAKGSAVDVKSNFYGSALSSAINVLVATYNSKGVMLKIATAAASIDASGNLTGVNSDFVIPADTARLKVFHWTDETMIPVTEAVVFE
ncbi:MAG: discoidin domain-containing protein [Oscillospiraceae bacterium]|nr:discoidin domain-containing protein [Oscillospiraceae bacterium]